MYIQWQYWVLTFIVFCPPLVILDQPSFISKQPSILTVEAYNELIFSSNSMFSLGFILMIHL
jgi:hypothetical protein